MSISYSLYLLVAPLALLLLYRVKEPLAIDEGVSAPVRLVDEKAYESNSKPSSPYLSIEVVVPARDEEESIGVLLHSLSQQKTTNCSIRVTVIDDHSSDSTAQVARSYGAEVFQSDLLLPGDNPKARALANYQPFIQGDVVVFLDADVTLLDSHLIENLGKYLVLGGSDLVSIQPFHRCGSIWESLSLFPNMVALMGSGAFSLWNKRHSSKVAFGPCLAAMNHKYQEVGGHQGICHEILDDAALARSFTKSGYRVSLYSGSKGVSFRMYPKGLRQLVEGFTKNLGAGSAGASADAVSLTALWITAFLGSFLHVIFDLFNGEPGSLLLSTATLVLYILETRFLGKKIGRYSPIWYVLAPIALSFFVYLFAASLVKLYVLRSVTWKGRSIVIGGNKGEQRRD
ncbi:4,4'-diaponeurosporenoate glycosyltransferase [Ferrithrix thermotolerans DSM 19514]|uniref:4,4'-diaponeurosporenoate glycosyltransferase n=1 Tax=Ferrithrix thermotolerans DSM 19514 TaxID=1121881 RepID=A0A1M4S4W0_9ACTN|nr:glycosyltransferase family 2 protein [Ferrithrix thermotolerans]SHE27238.1 4,4'-diaponeurosporenoate glycosyltransferase [Ferrithrix thermotolerans DSM 19514]